MTDKEKVAMLIGFIKGTINGNMCCCVLDVKSALEIIDKVEKI